MHRLCYPWLRPYRPCFSDGHTNSLFDGAGADNPTYLKRGAADYAVNAVGGLLALSGLYRIGNGLYHMSFGTDVLDIQ